MRNIDEEIRETEKKLNVLKDEKLGLEMSDPACELAIFLHDMTCRYDHTEGCGWFYEIKNGKHDWSRYAHQQELRRARKLLEITDADTIKKIVCAAH